MINQIIFYLFINFKFTFDKYNDFLHHKNKKKFVDYHKFLLHHQLNLIFKISNFININEDFKFNYFTFLLGVLY